MEGELLLPPLFRHITRLCAPYYLDLSRNSAFSPASIYTSASVTALNTGSVVTRVAGLAEAEIGGEIMLMNADKGAYYALNRAGSRVWIHIARPASVSAICDTLLTEFEVERDVCEQQLLDLLHEMQSEGIVEVREAA